MKKLRGEIKKITAFILIMLMIVNSMAVITFAEEQVSVWDGTAQEIIPVDDVYMINNASNLAWLSNRVNAGEKFVGKTFVLNTDIDLNSRTWTPIGYNLNNFFAGTFDGQDHTVSNIFVDINIDSANIINKTTHTVGLFGFCQSAQIIDTCIEQGHISITNASGYINQYCSINSNTNVYAGGVCGYAIDTTFNGLKVSNVYVESNTTQESNNPYAGGIVGYMEGGDVAYSSNVNNIVLSKSNSIASSASYAGGIVGLLKNKASIRQTYNSSKVTGFDLNATWYGGGIIGCSKNSTSTLSTVKNCYNTGIVNCAEGAVMGDDVLGGIVGYSETAVSSCYNSANVISNNDGYISTTSIGGIVGDSTTAASVYNCAVMSPKISSQNGVEKVIGGSGDELNNMALNNLSSYSHGNSVTFDSDFPLPDAYKNFLKWDFESIWEVDPQNEYPVLQEKTSYTDEVMEQLYDIASQLQIVYASGDKYNRVTKNIELYSSVAGTGATISWVSSNNNVIDASSGNVTRLERNCKVNLEATIKIDEFSLTKTFVLNVLGTDESTSIETADWGMTIEQAREFVALLHGCNFDSVPADDPQVLVLTGAIDDEEVAIETVVLTLKFLGVPEESALLKEQMTDVVATLKSGEDKVIGSFVGGLWINVNKVDKKLA